MVDRCAHIGISTVRAAAGAGLVWLGASTAFADATRYQEIELPWPSSAEIEVLHGFPDLEPMGLEENVSIRFLSNPELTEELEAAGFRPRVLVDDLSAFYAARSSTQQSRGGTFGDFHSYSEMQAELDAIHAEFPSITTAKFSIGLSLEGRPMWAMKVSDNPGTDEPEPEVLFDALHHAREPITVSVLLTYIRWLCENYGTDPEATFLVDNREQWFVPVVNPDGYVYNEVTFPGGGGMWRKNRRDVAGSCDGVDLNRNYSYFFGGSDGSSGDPCDETYRGTGPFSEPESQAMRTLMRSRAFVTHNSYHSVVGLILCPWGYTTTTPPEFGTFLTMIDGMSRDSGYGGGSAGSVLYIASGVAFDYAFGETTEKPKIYSFTTEVGGSGFWPLDSEIPGLVAENLYSNVYLATVAGAFVTLSAVNVTGGNGNGRLDPGETANLVITAQNAGIVATAQNVSATLASDDSYVQLVDANAFIGSLAPGASGSSGLNPFVVQVDPSAPEGHEAAFNIVLTWSDGSNDEQASLTIGIPAVVASDDFETATAGWGLDPSDTASSGQWVRVDPNPTQYQPDDDTTPAPGVTCWVTGQNSTTGNFDVDGGIAALRSPEFDLSDYSNVEATLNYFFGQRDAGDDPAGDYFRIDVSNDGGATFPVSALVLGDVASGPEWVPLSFDVEDLLPLTSQMMFRFQGADDGVPTDIIEAGIDDFVLFDRASGNLAPGAPALSSPPDGAMGQPGDLTLSVSNATDPDGDTLTYGFRVYADALLTNVVRAIDAVPSGVLTTEWAVSPPLPDGTFYWRAFASDAELRGPFMNEASFGVSGSVGVGQPSSSLVVVSAPSPNPTTAGTSLDLALPATGRVRAEVFDARGRLVRTIFRGVLEAGARTLSWDGRDAAGRAAAPGEYFVLVRHNDQLFTRKAILVD
jgi:hypothetical protein